MAASPFRRRKAAKTVRNLAFAEAALALAKDRASASARRDPRRPNGKLLLLGGAVATAGAAALLKRDKVLGLLPSRAGEPEPPGPPQPSNYDAPGPVANTATPIPAPDPHGTPPATIDERAEEAAAAAEAAAIGGPRSDYAGAQPGQAADEAHRPLAEAGEGEAEGQEQAEAQLAENATSRDAGVSDAQRRIEDTIEQADQPQSGERPEPLAPAEPGPGPAATQAQQPGAQEGFLPPAAGETPGGGISGRPYAGLDEKPEGPAAAAPGSTAEPGTTEQPGTGTESQSGARPEPAPEPKAEEKSGEDQGSDDWRTWSGRSVDP